MPANRFTKSHRLTEKQFIGIVCDFVIGRNAAACAERVQVSSKSVRRYYGLLRERLIEDESISGWMGGGAGILPDAEDPVWGAIKTCLMDCPANTAQPVSDEYDPHFYHAKREKAAKFERLMQKKALKCETCPFENAFVIDPSFMQTLAFHQASIRGASEGSFRGFYFESMFRNNIGTASRKFPDNPHSEIVGLFLASCKRQPI